MGKDFLQEIVEYQKQLLKRKRSFQEIVRPPRPPEGMTRYGVFRKAIARSGQVSLIAEIKKASPSAGLLRPQFDPAALARVYAESGAAALSVLTEKKFFQGKLGDMRRAAEVSGLPVLRKDFILDEIQIDEAYRFGASAVLLIVAILTDGQLTALREKAASYDLDCLVEVHNEEELDRALQTGADIIGINHRDLRTFQTDLGVSGRLVPQIPKDKVIVAESGIKTHDDLCRLRDLGVQAVLIGEAFLRAADVAASVQHLMQG